MAGDWIKMRASLCTNAKVLKIAALIGCSGDAGRRLSTGFSGSLDEIVTRDVTRDVTLASLMRVWWAVNEHTDDGVWRNADLETIDQVAGVPGFGQAMEIVGWAIFNERECSITFPNFLENNAPAKNGARSPAAERQRRYRERLGQSSDVTQSVTRDVTVTPREEKRREEKETPVVPGGFEKFVSAYPKSRINSKRKALALWQRDKLEPIAAAIVAHVERMASTPDWTRDGCKYVPNITTYLNDARWESAGAAKDPLRADL